MDIWQRKKAREFLKAKRKVLVYHRDIDGITSTALLLRFFRGRAIPIETPKLDEELAKKLEKSGAELLVFLDLAIDQEWKKIRKLEKNRRILIIDHHLFSRDLNSGKTLYINPRILDRKIYVSASHAVYNFLKALGKDVKGLEWIAALGVAGDYAFEDGRDVIQASKIRIEKLKDLGGLISSAVTAAGNRGAALALNGLKKSKGLDEFASDRKMREWKERVDDEIRKALEDFGEKAEIHKKRLAFFELKSKLSITSAVSTLLAEKYPEMTIAIIRRDLEGWKISLRNQSGKVNLNELAKKATKGIGRGGGHEKAAGAFTTDLEKFRERVLKAVK